VRNSTDHAAQLAPARTLFVIAGLALPLILALTLLVLRGGPENQQDMAGHPARTTTSDTVVR
jgi:hypothetical protein